MDRVLKNLCIPSLFWVGFSSQSVATCPWTWKDWRPRSHLHQCKHRTFPFIFNDYSGCAMWQLLWIPVKAVDTDWTNNRLVSKNFGGTKLLCSVMYIIALYEICSCQIKDDEMAEHVVCVGEKKNACRGLVQKPEGKRPPERLRHR